MVSCDRHPRPPPTAHRRWSRLDRVRPARAAGQRRLARRPPGPARGADPRRPLAARRERPGDPSPRATSRAPSISTGPTELIDPLGRRRRAAAGRPESRSRRAAAGGRRRRRDGRDLRRHGRRCSRPGPGGACGCTASSRRGSSTAASRRWAEEGRPISNAVVPPPPATFTPRAQPRMRLATADVRGAARVAGRDAARRARAGRVPRLRGQHEAARPHPGRRQRARSGR